MFLQRECLECRVKIGYPEFNFDMLNLRALEIIQLKTESDSEAKQDEPDRSL